MNKGFSLVPILLGAAAGALVAVLQAPKPSRPAPSKPAPAAAAMPSTPVPAAQPKQAESAEAAAAAPALSPSAAPLASSAPAPSAAPAASNAGSVPSKPVFDLSEPGDAVSLLEAQVACNRSVPEACERAARALESGSTGAKDPGRGRALKRIALTLYVKQCEGSRPAACARLAEMYEVGEVVQKSEKSVQGLRARVAELCKSKPTELGCGAGS